MVLSEELQQLSETAHGFLKEHAGARAFRAMRDANPKEGFDTDLWLKMAELGWSGIALPESLGGYDMGPTAVAVVASALGAHLASSPFVGTVFAARAFAAAGATASEDGLTQMAEGKGLFAIALDEKPRHAGLSNIEMRAESDGARGFVLTGLKRNVLDASAAQRLIVVARTAPGSADSGLTAFVVPLAAEGVTVDDAVQLDMRRTASVRFEGVRVGGEAVIGEIGAGAFVVAEALETARMAVAAEIVGASKAVFAVTVDYMRDRKQFGVPIGSFQALQHRAAHLHTELAIAEAAVMKAARVLSEDPGAAPKAVAVAKSKAGSVGILTANEAVQLHGGVGVTDEFDVGLYVKRIRTLENLLGDHRFHAGRYAQLNGY